MKKRVIILGCTGSIGKSTIEVIRQFPGNFTIVGLSAHSQIALLLALAKEFSVKNLCLTNQNITVSNESINFTGSSGLQNMIAETEADIVVNGITGAAGLLPSVATVLSGKDLALANKETAVMAGRIIFSLAEKHNARILPVDSEHSAIFKLLENKSRSTIQDIILTASGGPFRGKTKQSLTSITPEQAIAHPTWKMGAKISIDSATLANKGLEVIETQTFFQVRPEQIRVLIHPQSIVHSFITTIDGAMYAQISRPDMKLPIMTALSYPVMLALDSSQNTLTNFSLNFEEPDFNTFPMLLYSYEALKAGKAYPLAYNAANEIAVEAFCAKQIPFLAISDFTRAVLELDWNITLSSIEEVLEADTSIRLSASRILTKFMR